MLCDFMYHLLVLMYCTHCGENNRGKMRTGFGNFLKEYISGQESFYEENYGRKWNISKLWPLQKRRPTLTRIEICHRHAGNVPKFWSPQY